jgi:hypothetical protein
VEKYGTARQATDDNIIRRMRFTCWITKATDTQNMQYSLLFHSNNGYADTPQCHVIRTLPVLLNYNAANSSINNRSVAPRELVTGAPDNY